MPASNLLLIRPSAFGYNTQTAASNVFQQPSHLAPEVVQKKALEEFNGVIKILEQAGINHFIFDDNYKNPDAIFPNNWISFHHDGTVVLYPMLSEIRRKERRTDIPEKLREYFTIKRMIDLTDHEDESKFLEGTGSIVFDHKQKTAYAALSPRTDAELFNMLCTTLQYEPVCFSATDPNEMAIYHTNVMMSVSEEMAIICSESIKDAGERDRVLNRLKAGNRPVLKITQEQMCDFAGNILAVKDDKGNNHMLMSAKAAASFNTEQMAVIKSKYHVLAPDIQTVETVGGGSLRCMMAEIFLPVL